MAHTDPDALTVGERLIEGLPENVPDVVGLRDWEFDVVKLPLPVEHTEPEGVAVGHRVADAQAELEGVTVGERLMVTLLLYVGDTEGERDWLGDGV